jgi:hypothetical protein
MKVYVNGKPTGNATLSQKVIANGQKMIDLGMVISSAGRQVTVHSESTYDAKGAPIRKYQDTLVLGKIRKSRRVIVSFDKGGANVVLVVDGDRTTKYVPLDPQADRADGSEFWFLKGIPKVGEEVHAYRFNLDTLNWDMVNTVYKGVRPMSIDNRRVVTYVTDSEEGTAYFGKDGLPLRLELPYAAMERIWEKS